MSGKNPLFVRNVMRHVFTLKKMLGVGDPPLSFPRPLMYRLKIKHLLKLSIQITNIVKN